MPNTSMINPNYDALIWQKKGLPDKIVSNEDIVLVARQDLILMIARGLGLYLVFFLILLVRVILLGFLDAFWLAVYDTFLFGTNVVLLTYFALVYHNYFLSIQLVTSERIIDIDQKGIFSREVNALPLGNIEDVSYKQAGFLGTVFNYGDVIVQTAGSTSSGPTDGQAEKDTHINGFVFNKVPHPADVAGILINLFQAAQAQDRESAAKANAQAMIQALNYKGRQ